MFITATAIAYWWDIVMDWGLFQRGTTKRFLRDRTMYPSLWVYYAAIVSNLFLRVTWIIPFALELDSEAFSMAASLVLAVMEIYRRFQWNFFRMENEHANNTGEFRAVQDIPLPFERDPYESDLEGIVEEPEPPQNDPTMSIAPTPPPIQVQSE